MTDMWFELAKALSEMGVFLWPEQKYDSPRTRVDEKVPGFVKTPHGTPFEEVYIADEIPDYIKRSNVN